MIVILRRTCVNCRCWYYSISPIKSLILRFSTGFILVWDHRTMISPLFPPTVTTTSVHVFIKDLLLAFALIVNRHLRNHYHMSLKQLNYSSVVVNGTRLWKPNVCKCLFEPNQRLFFWFFQNTTLTMFISTFFQATCWNYMTKWLYDRQLACVLLSSYSPKVG